MRSPDIATDASTSWLDLLQNIQNGGVIVHPRKLACREVQASQSFVDMTQPIVTVKSRQLGYRFMCAEAWWILTGRNDVESIKQYSQVIATFSDDGKRFNGAYGPMILDQLSHVVNSLISDPHSRQAVMTIWRPNPRPSRDVPCTVSLQWMIRTSPFGLPELHCIDTMRSSDAWLGWPYDVFNFSMLSAVIALEIRSWAKTEQLRLKDEIARVAASARDSESIIPIGFDDRLERANLLSQLDLGILCLAAGSQHYYCNGAVNIPYTEDDVRRVIMLPEAWNYRRLHIEEIASPRELIERLHYLKDAARKPTGTEKDGGEYSLFMNEFHHA